MTSSSIATVLLYFSIIATSLLLRERKLYLFGAILIGTCLQFIELPDIIEYKAHYQLTSNTDFRNILLLSNFEPGYVVLVTILSKFLPFEVFYVAVVTLAIHAYTRFFEKCADNYAYIYIVLFLSVCLYFIAFTLRSTIASIVLAYSLLYLKDKKNLISAALIVFAATFHIVVAPLIMLPILNNYSSIIKKHFIYFFSAAIIIPLVLARYLSLDFFVGNSEILDLKISAYDGANINVNGFYFGLWIFAIIGSFYSYKYLIEFERVLIIATVFIIVLFHPFGFIQGRFMWLTSFVFAYIFTRVVFSRINLGAIGRLIFLVVVPLAVFARF